MSDPVVRTDEGLEENVVITWDTDWHPWAADDPKSSTADWAVADPALEPRNVGGLQSLDPLATAVILQMETDLRKPDYEDNSDGYRAGWHGDTFDLDEAAGERPAGSLMYLLRRAALTEENRQKAVVYATQAMQPLLVQGAIASHDITAEIDYQNGYLKVRIVLFASTGKSIYANDFPIR